MRCIQAAILLLLFCSVPARAFQVVGGTIIDGDGQTVQLRGINWFGFETSDHVIHGLWTRNWRDMVAQIKALGFNAVRLPVCPDTLHGQTRLNIDYTLNPDLLGMDSQQVLDTVIAHLDAEGIYILLDHHRPDCNAISELWYTGSYSEQQWIADLVWMADRYQSLPHFIGIDLKNEPHGAATWGTGNPATDWNRAAERAAAAILAQASDRLIFVEGIENNPDCSGSINHWWGGNLEPLNCYPLAIPTSQLVLSPHVYGPDVFNQPYFDDPAFPANMPLIWEQHFGQFIDQGQALVIGEFGGRYGHGGDPRDRIWQDALVDYLIGKGVNSGFYWSWNPNSGDTGGLLQDDWTTVWQDKLDLLDRLWGRSGLPACADGLDNDGDGSTDFPDDPDCESSTDPSEAGAEPPLAACADGADNDGDGQTDYPDDPGCDSITDNDEADPPAGGDDLVVSVEPTSDWNTGYCADVRIANTGSTTADWTVTVEVDGTVDNLWNAHYSQQGRQLTAHGMDWNNTVQPGHSVVFGFCADRSAAPAPTPPPTPLCSDGIDNDGDGSTDFPDDAGCSSTDDDDETDPSGSLTANVTTTADWSDGYCADVTVANASPVAIDWVVAFDIEGTIDQLWNATYSQAGRTVNAQGLSWNDRIPAGGSVAFGFCANR